MEEFYDKYGDEVALQNTEEEFQLVLVKKSSIRRSQGRGVAILERPVEEAFERVRMVCSGRVPGIECLGLPILLFASKMGRNRSNWYVSTSRGFLVSCLARSVLSWPLLGLRHRQGDSVRDALLTTNDSIAAIEEWVISNVQKIIPDGVKQQWHDWRDAVKGVEKEELGNNHISEDVEKVGWGVEEAQMAHKADASKSTTLFSISRYSFQML